MDTIIYYINALASLCGFDGSDDSALFGWLVITAATLTVIYAFYRGITWMIWPGENDRNHIKYMILDDEELLEVGDEH